MISKVSGREDLNHLDNWAEDENLQLLNLTYVLYYSIIHTYYYLQRWHIENIILLCCRNRYDATPSDYVSMIVTDYGMVSIFY